MRFAFLLLLLLADAGLVSASDNRLLYTIPHPGAMDSFASDFGTTCATWEPAIHGASLIFSEALVEPGDFSGKNNQTQALLVCAWTNGVISTFTKDIAAALGATPA